MLQGTLIFCKILIQISRKLKSETRLQGMLNNTRKNNQQRYNACYITNYIGYKLVRQLSLPAETVRHNWLPPRLSAITCFLPKLLSAKNGFLPKLSACLCFLPRDSAGSRITQTESAGNHLSYTTVSAGDSLDGSEI